MVIIIYLILLGRQIDMSHFTSRPAWCFFPYQCTTAVDDEDDEDDEDDDDDDDDVPLLLSIVMDKDKLDDFNVYSDVPEDAPNTLTLRRC